MNLYIVHCGFYDKTVTAGLYEGHTNFMIAAEDFKDAKAKAKALPEFKRLHMHVDGIQEIVAVEGYRVDLKRDAKTKDKTIIKRVKFGSTKPTIVEL